MKIRIFFVVLLSVLFTLVAAQCGSTNTPIDARQPETTSSPAAISTPLPPTAEIGQSTIFPTQPSELSAVDGKTLLENSCTQCHSLDRVTSAKKDAAGWQANVDRMIGKGARLSDVEKTALIQYLVENYH